MERHPVGIEVLVIGIEVLVMKEFVIEYIFTANHVTL
jgi:hypothetical protein